MEEKIGEQCGPSRECIVHCLIARIQSFRPSNDASSIDPQSEAELWRFSSLPHSYYPLVCITESSHCRRCLASRDRPIAPMKKHSSQRFAADPDRKIWWPKLLLEPGLLVLDGNVTASGRLV